jgi:GT2 family glycosyltransferase
MAEIRGYIRGKGGYRRARKKIVPDESKRPDKFRISPTVSPASKESGKTALVSVDVAEQLGILHQGEGRETLEILVQWKGRPLGRVTIRCGGFAVPPSRLADEIATTLGREVVTRGEANPSEAWSREIARWQNLLNPPTPETDTPRELEGVSVIVATCGRTSDLRRCLASLMASETARPVQYIVVDNRPGSGSAREVLKDFPGVELVEEPKPGSSYARNAGVAAAREKIVAMTDDDMVVSPQWLERLVSPLVRNDVAVVTGNTLPASLDSEAEIRFEEYGGFSRGTSQREFDECWFHRWRRRATPTWQLGGTGNLAFRRSLFEDPRVGHFDERLGAGVPAGVGEDTLWFYQVLRSGHVIIYEPSAVAWHHHRVTMKELRRQLMAYSKGHVAYHMLTFIRFRDNRALVRLGYELPRSVASRLWSKLRGRNRYPLRLLAVEIVGMLLGPFSLWQSTRHVSRYGVGARHDPSASKPV